MENLNLYYTPAIDRMSGVEILKGSGQILYGPQTIGGVVNYITANPPQEQEGAVRIQGGQGGLFTGCSTMAILLETPEYKLIF